MNYLKDVPFLDRKGIQLTVNGEKQTSVSLLRAVLGAWQPSKDVKESNLTPAQIRIWQRLMDDLEGGTTEGVLALEDDRFNLAKYLVLPLMQSPSYGAGVLARYVPQMEDYLNSVTTTKPVEASPNGVPDEAKESVREPA